MTVSTKPTALPVQENYFIIINSESDNVVAKKKTGDVDAGEEDRDAVTSVESTNESKSVLKEPYNIIDTKNWAFAQSESLITFFNFISPIDWALAKPYVSFRAYGPYVVSYDKLVFDVWTEQTMGTGRDSIYGVTPYSDDGLSEAIGSEAYFAPVTLSHTNAAFRNRSNYHQKLKPLFAISDLDIDIIQAPGSISFTDNIKLRLTIFDRTKLRELTALFNPILGTHFVIEYGWQHPHAGKASHKNDFPFDMYGIKSGKGDDFSMEGSKWKTIPDFINSLRHRGVYILENFNITLGEGMSAVADLSLVSILGDQSSGGIGILNVSFKEQLAELGEQLVSLKKQVLKTRKDGNNKLFNRKAVEKQLNDKISILQGNKKVDSKKGKSNYGGEMEIVGKARENIQQRINSYFSTEKNKSFFNNGLSPLGQEGPTYQKTIDVPKIAGKKQKELSSVDITTDPTGKDYTYLLLMLEGLFKNLSKDIGSVKTSDTPSPYTDLVKNMHIRYCPFNSYCGLMSGRSIGSFIISKQEILDKIFEIVTANPNFNISLEKVFGMIESIVSNKMNPNYGMAEFFDYGKNIPLEKDNIEADYNNFIQNKSSGQFVLPKIRFRMISSSAKSDNQPQQGAATSYHIIIYDEASFDENGSEIKSADYEFSQSIKGKNNVEPIEEVKKKLISENGIPYVYPGTERSPISKVNVKTESNDLAAAIYLEQNKNSNPLISNRLTSQLDEIPLEYVPMEITVDMLGYPKLEPHHKIFFDFKTGTDIDSIYCINQIKHKIGKDSFKTTMTCNPMQSYAKYKTIAQFNEELEGTGDEEESASTNSASGKESGRALTDVAAISRNISSSAEKLLYKDMERLFLVKYFNETFGQKIKPQWDRSSVKSEHLALLEWKHGLGLTRHGEFYKLMGLLDLECYNLSKKIKGLKGEYDNVVKADAEGSMKTDIFGEAEQIFKAYTKSGLVGAVGERMNYAYFLTKLKDGVGDRKTVEKLISDAEEEIKKDKNSESALKSKNVLVRLNRFIPYLESPASSDFHNFFPDYDPTSKKKDEYTSDIGKVKYIKDSKSGNSIFRVMYYNSYDEDSGGIGGIFKVDKESLESLDYKPESGKVSSLLDPFYGLDYNFGSPTIEKHLLEQLKKEDTLPYLTFVETRLENLTSYYQKLKGRYEDKKATLSRYRDVFSEYVPEIEKRQVDGEKKYNKYWVVVYKESEPGKDIFKAEFKTPKWKMAASKAADCAWIDLQDISPNVSLLVEVYKDDKTTLIDSAFYQR